MRARPLTATITLGILVCGATVGLEAVGVLFHGGSADTAHGVFGADPERAEAMAARIETDLDSLVAPSEMVAPSEPVDLPSETEPAPLRPAAERASAPAVATHEEGRSQSQERTDPDAPGSEGAALAFSVRLDPGPGETSAPEDPEETASPPPQPPAAAPAVAEPRPVAALAAVQTSRPAPPQRVARPMRGPSARVRRTGSDGGFGCPVLDLLSQ
jgi:hypothetical protein